MAPKLSLRLLTPAVVALFLAAACGGSDGAAIDGDGNSNGGEGTGGDGNGGDGNGGDGNGGFGGGDGANGGGGGGGKALDRDPVDCEEAKSSHSYVGCDYWPTITPNSVAKDFHFVAAVANTGKNPAQVKVTGLNSFAKEVTVPPGDLVTIELPWIDALKGGTSASVPRPTGAVVKGGAYHLVSSSPVIVYQFNPLEFKVGGGNGAASYTNDASLLLPSTAMTGDYRVAGMHGWSYSAWIKLPPPFPQLGGASLPSVLSITATAPKTTVEVHLSSTGAIEVAGPIAASSAGSTVKFTLENAGDVAQLVGQGSDESDLSGSIVKASSPVQVISSVPCIYLPKDKSACDHIEETVVPAQAFGKAYVVAPPTGFDAKVAAQVVRIFGNRDGTKLTYDPKKPAGCPDTLSAGQVADCGVVGDAFVVRGDQDFTVQSYLLGASYYPGNNPQAMGDPSQTSYPAIEQFRKDYVFLAPTSYPVLWADVTAPQDATLTLDGNPVKANWDAIGSSGYGVVRLDLTKSGKNGVHSLTASKPIGVQVLGYATNTTFQYPAGLNLALISKAPEPK